MFREKKAFFMRKQKMMFSQRRLEKRTFPFLDGLQNTCFSPLLWKVSLGDLVRNVDSDEGIVQKF